MAILLIATTFTVTRTIAASRWLEIDTCLDAGGAWDHAADACRHQ